mmetsp:Transcript_898/g.2753  ORF Transcript_898/g.2753 Transcript_898/m.2753 type:complete len:391 (-) Transcript_898:1214-2386(-)
MAPPSVRSLLVNAKIGDMLKRKENLKVVCIRDSVTVEAALATLAKHKILSAPVLSKPTDEVAGQEGALECLCFVDINDVLRAFLQSVDAQSIKAAKMLAKMRTLEEKGADFCARTLRELSDSLGSDGGFLFEGRIARMTILELVHTFMDPQNSKGVQAGGHPRANVVHRLAVFNKAGDVTSVVSQSDVVRFLSERADDLGSLAVATVGSLGWANRAVKSVSPDTAAFDAMLQMSQQKVSALAVVQNGKLMGNFSASQLRSIMSEHFGSLALPVGEFLALEHGTEYAGYRGQPETSSPTYGSSPIPESPATQWARDTEQRALEQQPGADVGQALVCVKAESTFREVLDLLTSNRLHRLYAVDEQLQPIGLVTCTDVLKMVLQEAETGRGED